MFNYLFLISNLNTNLLFFIFIFLAVYNFNFKIIIGINILLLLLLEPSIYFYQKIFFINIKSLMNLKLTNGLFFIHPIFLYLSYFCVISLLLFVKMEILYINLFSIQNFKIKQFVGPLLDRNTKKLFKTITILIMFILITSIFLGSWWAQQELD